MNKELLIYINTYNRYDTTLGMCILSIINQTYKYDKFIIFDDTKEDKAKDPRDIEHLNYLFKLMNQKGINWEYRWGQKKGAHFNHEAANMEGFKYAFFIDDDCVLEPTCLENLMKEMKDGVGAVAGLILQPPAIPLPMNIDGTINDVWKGQNLQWYTWTGQPKECEHLYSSFLYRCNIVHHDLRLSSVVFRGETMFTHSLFLKGYKLIVTPEAITWHFQTTKSGGIHDGQKMDNWNHDQWLFQKWLEFKRSGRKLYVLNGGLGDNYMFLQAITPEPDALISTCFPYVFPNHEVIPIDKANELVDNKDYDVYRWCVQNNWKGTLIEAYKKLYENLTKSWEPRER